MAESSTLTRLAAQCAGLDPDDTVAAQWVIRVSLSLLFWPAANAAAESEILRSFVAPAFAVKQAR